MLILKFQELNNLQLFLTNLSPDILRLVADHIMAFVLNLTYIFVLDKGKMILYVTSLKK